jgi:hypothetical protein
MPDLYPVSITTSLISGMPAGFERLLINGVCKALLHDFARYFLQNARPKSTTNFSYRHLARPKALDSRLPMRLA